MKYIGGKSKARHWLIPVINTYTRGVLPYSEPFLGGCNVLPWVDSPLKIGSDINPEIIECYRQVAKDWIPPYEVSEELYESCKKRLQPVHLVGYVGVACSFGGKYFGGYARTDKTGKTTRNYAKEATNSLLKSFALPGVKNSTFIACDYLDVNPPVKSVIYCDPPYLDTTKYKDTIIHKDFWNWVRMVSQKHIVLVSEYTAPDDFQCVFEFKKITGLRNKFNKVEERLEKLFKYPIGISSFVG